VSSIHKLSAFDVFIGFLGDPPALPESQRVTCLSLAGRLAGAQRPYRFLLKFEVIAQCLVAGRHDFLVLMDADAVLARSLLERNLVRALGEAGFGMVEQKTIIGSGMNRADFLTHFKNHALPVIAPDCKAPELEDFRYYNSGVVVGRRESWSTMVEWARNHIATAVGSHEVGDHMVADQDYFQVWVNSIHPGSCTSLPWYWNHCEHWDESFPRPGVLFAHFSNFCNGPSDQTVKRMRRMRRAPRMLINAIAGRFTDLRDQ
jgi:hypothetical protein